jgi:hypothetical protein
MITLTKEEVIDAFVHIQLEEDYNFLESDLVKLANAIVRKAEPKIAAEERAKCLEVAQAYNTLVADKIKEVREKA